jgi:3-hydroxyisobutyrate dehydrogenase-like beta-hydroxyacid dehydrogenase
MDVGFLGLGHMGLPMAGRLAAAGFRLTVWNRTRGRASSLTAAGARLAGSPAELAAASDTVITMLADGAATAQILCGDGGVLAASRPGAVVIDMSTIGPQAARELAAAAGGHGVAFLDAPVSGSVALAEQGTLTAMIGGPADALDRVRPVLAAMTKAQFHLGPAGAGAAMKLAVNLIIAATSQSVGEAMALATAAGIDPPAAYDVLTASAVASPFIAYKRASFTDPDGAPVAFTAELMAKDLRLALSVAAHAALPLPVAEVAKDSLDQACAAGYAESDFACAVPLLRRAATRD